MLPNPKNDYSALTLGSWCNTASPIFPMYDSPTSDDVTSNYDVLHSMMPIYVTGMECFLRTTNHHQISNHHTLFYAISYMICTLIGNTGRNKVLHGQGMANWLTSTI